VATSSGSGGGEPACGGGSIRKTSEPPIIETSKMGICTTTYMLPRNDSGEETGGMNQLGTFHCVSSVVAKATTNTRWNRIMTVMIAALASQEMDATMPILEKKPTVVLVIQVVVLGVVHIPLHLVLERGERGELGEVAGERVEEENG
jgi:hypothetical protein